MNLLETTGGKDEQNIVNSGISTSIWRLDVSVHWSNDLLVIFGHTCDQSLMTHLINGFNDKTTGQTNSKLFLYLKVTKIVKIPPLFNRYEDICQNGDLSLNVFLSPFNNHFDL